MSHAYLKYFAVPGTMGALISGVFLFPPLTSGTGSLPSGVSFAEFEAAAAQERAHCEALDENIDCGCFADVSGYILSQDPARVPFAIYADREQLARGQAEDSC